jgi:hypothetical protein
LTAAEGTGVVIFSLTTLDRAACRIESETIRVIPFAYIKIKQKFNRR